MVSSTSGAMAAAAQGLMAGQARFADAAGRIVAEPDSVAAIVDQKLAAAQVATSAKIVRSVDDMLGSLIDTLA
jgi:hypothetical protein